MAEHHATTGEPALTILDPPKPIFQRRRFLLNFVPFAVVALIGAIALYASGTVALPFRQPKLLKGKLASKAEFFQDEQVRRILMANGIQVHVTKAGSRDIANNDLDDYDFVFPSGQPAALLIRSRREAEHRYSKVHKPFFSPIVLATFLEYAVALKDHARATPQKEGRDLYYDLPMNRFVDLMDPPPTGSPPKKPKPKTWSDLGLANGNRVLAQTSDTCSSNSAATYLGLVAFVRNGNQIPENEQQAMDLAASIKPVLTGQGLPGDDMAKNFLAPEGKGLAPVAVIYEHQYLAHQVRFVEQNQSVDTDRVLLYPEAQVQTVPELIALTENGDRLGELITSDPGLRKRALELGFRVFEPDGTLSGGQLSGFLKGRGIPVPLSGAGDTETFLPALPLLEKMIAAVGDCPQVPR